LFHAILSHLARTPITNVAQKARSLVTGKQRQRKRLQKWRWIEEEAGAEITKDRGGKGES